MLKILCLGDVVGKRSCEYLRHILPGLKQQLHADLTIVNAENSADGNGVTPFSAKHLLTSGADILTGGNHTMKRKEVYELLDNSPVMTRPYNLCSAEYGHGIAYADLGHTVIAVINLSGTVYMEPSDNAFLAADAAIDEAKAAGAKMIVVDFHAEATSEKIALAHYLDGKVSVFFGTHTHVATADASVLPGGTGYITDLGMCGPTNSVLGVDAAIIVDRFRNGGTTRFAPPDTPIEVRGCLFTVDPKTGHALSAEPISICES